MRHFVRLASIFVLLIVQAACTPLTAKVSDSQAVAEPTPTPSPPAVALTCAAGYTIVPANATLGTAEFCISIYEMRNLGGVATPDPTRLPWSNVSRDFSVTTCEALGAGYTLISNSQWQAVARNIAGVAANWSSGTVRSGYLNIGNADNGVFQTCSSVAEYVDGNCDPVGSAGNFIYRRTHQLSTGQMVWDLGGNQYELTRDLSTSGQYASDGCVDQLTATNPLNDILGLATRAFGLDSLVGYTFDRSVAPCAGFGGVVGSNTNNSVTNRVPLRGGSSYDQSGIFAVDLGWAERTTADSSFSFRCVYRP